MTREKEIDEMVGIIGSCPRCCGDKGCCECDAERLYDAGWRKIPDTPELTEEEIIDNQLTDTKCEELEEQAKGGVAPSDHIAYKQNFQWLFQFELSKKVAKAASDKAALYWKEQAGKEVARCQEAQDG